MNHHRFIMLFDEDASPTLEAVMASSMSLRFPDCRFDADKAPGAMLENTVIPIVGTIDNDTGRGGPLRHPPAGLTSDVQDAFDDILREARAARPS